MKKIRSLFFPICFCAYMCIYIARVNLSIAAPELRQAMILTTEQVGLLGGVFSVVYASGRMISGVVGDRVAPWKLVCLGLGLVTLSSVTIGFLPPFWCIFLLWAANALAQSMLWSPLLRIIAYKYPPEAAKKKASVLGLAVASGNVAGIIISSAVITRFGAAWGFFVPGITAFIFCILIFLSAGEINPPAKDAQHSITPGSLFAPIARSQVRRMMVPAMLHGVIKDNVSLWMGVYMADRFGLHIDESAWYILLIPLAGMAGRFMFPLLFKLTRSNEYAVSGIGAAIGFVSAVILIAGPSAPIVGVLCLSASYAAVSIINTTILAIFPMQFAAENFVSSVSGFMDLSTYMGAGIGSFVFARLIRAAGYTPMFVIWAAASAVCALCFFLARRFGLRVEG